MVGRIAITLCLLVQVAIACPPPQPAGEMERVLALEETLVSTIAEPFELDDTAPGDDINGLAIALGLMGISTLIFAVTRRNAVHRTFARRTQRKTESSLELAQALARLHRRRVLVVAVACGLVLHTIMTRSIAIEDRLVWSVTPAIVLAIAVATLWRLQSLLGLRNGSSLTTVLARGDFLFVAREDVLVSWVAASPRLLSRAAVVPVARRV